MNQKDVVRQRILTLSGLIDGPGGPFGSSGGDVAARLVGGWAAERRLLQRLADETKGDDVLATIQMWHDRTTAFLAKASPGEDGAWHDRDGHRWVAVDVLRILDDLVARIETWRVETTPTPPTDMAVAVAARALEIDALRESLGDDAASLEEALGEALEDDDDAVSDPS